MFELIRIKDSSAIPAKEMLYIEILLEIIRVGNGEYRLPPKKNVV